MRISVKPRRIISNVMVVAMMLSLMISMPLTAQADEPPMYTLTVSDVIFDTATGEITNYTNDVKKDIIIPSTFTVGVTDWEVTSIGANAFKFNALTSVIIPDSVLTIGRFAFESNALTSVIIPDSVLTIGWYAFAWNDLTSVTIGNSVTSIGGEAFSYNALTSVTIPGTVTSIGEAAFLSNALTSVTIGNGILTIGRYAFYVNALTSVTIPGTVTSIGEAAFKDNALTSVTIGKGVTTIEHSAFNGNAITQVTSAGYTNTNGIIYARNANGDDLTTIVSYGGIADVIDFIPDSVTSIGAYAFAKSDLTSITIPDSVTSIGDHAFAWSDLTSVTIGNSVTSIGAYAFAWSDRPSITLPDTAFGYNVTWEGGNSGSVTAISDFTDAYTRITGAIINYTINYNLAVGATNAGGNPATYTIETPTITLDTPTKANCTFFGWYSDSGFTHGNEVIEIVLGSTGDVDLFAKLMYTLTVSEVTFDTATGEITNYTNDVEKAIIIPSTFTVGGTDWEVTSIGANAFEDNALTSVTIPDTVTSIGEFAFMSNALTSVTIGNSVTSIGEAAFESNDLTSVVIGNGVTTIGNHAFRSNDLTSVIIPDNVTTIGDWAFAWGTLTSVTIGNGVISIGPSAFANNPLASLSIPDSVTSIGASAFFYNALASVTIGNGVTTIGDRAFEGNALTSVIIPDSVTSIGLAAFDNNSALLTSIALPDTAFGYNVTWEGGNSGSVTAISDFTDAYTRITGAIINYTINYNLAVGATNAGGNPATYTIETPTITLDTPTKANCTFFGWYSDSGFTHGNEVIEIVLGSTGDVDLFAKLMYTLTVSEVTFDTATGAITDYTNDVEKAIIIPSTFTVGGTDYPVMTIGDRAFEANALTSVTIPDSVTSIGAYAFAYNSASLTAIALPDTASGYAVKWEGSTSGSVTEISDFTDSYTRTTIIRPTSATPTEKLEDAIKGAIPNEKGVIEVAVELEDKHDGTFSLVLPENFMADEEVEITIRAGRVKVTLSNTMFTGDEDSMEIVIEPVDKNKLNLSDEVNALIGDLPIYNISLTINGEKAGWESDTAIDISFGLAEDADLDAYKFVVVYIDEYGNVKLLKSSMYSDGEMHFNTTHLSYYAIVYVDNNFDDLGGYAWAAEAIEALAARSVINGTSDTAFSPAGDITRADFITLLVRYFDFISGTDGNFDDVKSEMYYTDAIAIAKDLGIVTGTGDNMFKPLESIARQDMMVMLERAIKAAGLEEVLAQSSISYESFDDSGSVAGYAIDSVDFMVKIGVIQGSDNKLNPTDNITRAETAQVLYNLLNALG